MILHTRLTAEKLRLYKKKNLTYLPDFIIYDTDKQNYLAFWRNLTKAPSNYLYTDGVQVYKVNWFQAKFQAIKGFFGFENNCQAAKIELTLAKILYYGYLKGFNADLESDKFANTIISTEFINTSKLRRTDKNSTFLQNKLMYYYGMHSSAITRFEIPLEYFGELFLTNELYELIPRIDPQSDNLIKMMLTILDRKRIELNHSTCSLEEDNGQSQDTSNFAKQYAKHLISKNKLMSAQQWWHETQNQYPKEFIEYYLRNNAQFAIVLINQLYQSNFPINKPDALSLLKTHYETLKSHLSSYTALKTALAESYLEDAFTQNNRYSLIKLILGNDTKQLLNKVYALDPGVLSTAPFKYNALKQLWYSDRFMEAIKQKHWNDAKVLYENNPSYNFDKKSLLELCNNYYKKEYKNLAEKISKALGNKQTALVAELAKNRIEIAKKIEIINPQEELLDSAIYDDYETQLELDKIKKPFAKDADITVLDNLIKGIKQYDNHLKLLNAVLLRKIDCCLERVQVSVTYEYDPYTRKEWLIEHKQDIDNLINNLQEFISTNEEAPSEEVKPLLAKMYYLMGDAQNYFQEDTAAAIANIKKASLLMPANICYKLHYYALIDDPNKSTEWEKLEKIAPTFEQKYMHWFEERWCEVKIMAPGFNVHQVISDNSHAISDNSHAISPNSKGNFNYWGLLDLVTLKPF